MKARGLPTHHIATEIFSVCVGSERFSPPARGSTAQVVQRPLPPHHFQRRAFASRAASHRRYPSQTSISSPLIAHRTRRGGVVLGSLAIARFYGARGERIARSHSSRRNTSSTFIRFSPARSAIRTRAGSSFSGVTIEIPLHETRKPYSPGATSVSRKRPSSSVTDGADQPRSLS